MKPKIASLTLCLSLLLAAADARPAAAQSISPYSYLYMGQSLMYPLSRVFGLPYMYGPYNSNPFYSMNSFMRPSNSLPNVYPFTNGTYGPWGYRNAGMMPGYFNNGSNNSNNPNATSAVEEPDNANPGANTMNSTNPYQSPPPASYTNPPAPVPSSGGAPGGQAIGAYVPPASPSTGGAASASPTASVGAGAAPVEASPVVPQTTHGRRHGHSSSSSPASSPTSSAPSSVQSALPAVPAVSPAAAAPLAAAGHSANPSPGLATISPLAESFIKHLNSNYQGDMSKALSDKDTRSWARAMGVIGDDVQDGTHLSSDRLDVIGRLLKDNTLDPVSKLDTMRILLKKTPPAGN